MKKKNSKEAADFPGRFGALTWRLGDLMKNFKFTLHYITLLTVLNFSPTYYISLVIRLARGNS